MGQGEAGPTGVRGSRGQQGPRGDAGRAGPPGPTGQQVEQTSAIFGSMFSERASNLKLIALSVPQQGAAGPDGAPGARGSSVSFYKTFYHEYVFC